MSSDEEGGKSQRYQSKTVKALIKLFLFSIIILIAFLFIPELGFDLAVYLVIIAIIISILSGDWIKKHPLFGFILLLLLIVIVLVVIATTLLSNVGLISERELTGFRARISESWFRTGNFSFNPFAQWREFQNRQVAIATGDHFSGQVEESKDDEELGLHLERLESSGMNLIENQEAVFWVTLRGKSLGETIINGVVGCNASDGDEFRRTSEREFSFFSYEMNQYECRFDRLPSGSVNIKFWAEYNFRTLGYQKSYFIDQERLRTLISLNQDPLREAGITDRNPRSIFTQGPINLGIGTSDYLPIPVDDNHQRVFVLGITLETRARWQGKINRINDLEIQVPKSMYIRVNECDHNFKESTNENCISRCQGISECEIQCGDYYFYVLEEQELNRIGDVEQYITFKCPVYVENKNELLGTSPVSTRFFRVLVDYNFKSELSRIFYIQEKKEENEI